MSTAQKILLFAVGALVLAFFVVIGITTATEGQKIANSGTAQAKEVSNEYSEIDRSVYDGTDALGSTVSELIDTVIEDKEELSILVKTNANKTSGTYYNYTMSTANPYTLTVIGTPTPAPTKITEPDFINPDAQFRGKVYKDANNNIIAIEFTQHK
jgi:hypothetical protein